MGSAPSGQRGEATLREGVTPRVGSSDGTAGRARNVASTRVDALRGGGFCTAARARKANSVIKAAALDVVWQAGGQPRADSNQVNAAGQPLLIYRPRVEHPSFFQPLSRSEPEHV